MPVMYIKAITQDKQETRNLYECPVYKTRQRGMFEISDEFYRKLQISFRSNLHLDIQSQDQGETIQMGVGWSCSPTSDIDT